VNSAVNKIKRQQFSMEYVNLLLSGKIIINVDESAISSSDNRSMS